ncbi:MAG: serine/threonine protein kinase [Acidobacteria bacterium]|nr:serine/threonine protein kinase [Acidobacteriota bacterium]
MPLSAGTRLGPYEILAPIGAGGMGEVYRAKDGRLDRTVAIKVLSAHIADNAEARQCFEREARATSSLNHPHICVLHDVGHQGGIDFLVMEYLEGETLAARLSKGPLGIGQSMQYAIQIADALAAAHRRGISHRDLKPGNVMLTKSGAKLLDFGLAKLHAPGADQAGAGASDLLTVSQGLTEKGTILGTVQYMAPEQLDGKEADARADIFAFGAVLYEMVTGRKAFEGQSRAGMIGAILHANPSPLSALQPLIPPALERLVNACLAKDPDERWQTAHDLKLELQWVETGQSTDRPRATVPRMRDQPGQAHALASSTRCSGGETACRDRRRVLSILVSGQPVSWLLRRREAEEDRDTGWSSAYPLRRPRRTGRHMESRWHDRIYTGCRSGIPHFCRGWRGGAPHEAGCGAPGGCALLAALSA